MRRVPHLGAVVIGVAVCVGSHSGRAESNGRARVEAAPASALAIIVNHRNPVGGLTLVELRRIFVLESQYWPHGSRITLVLREPGQPERAQALRLACGMTEDQYRLHLLQETFRGRVNTSFVRTIRTAEDMRAFVFNARNAIGHVLSGEVDDTVKVLRIEGRLPNDPRYPLAAVGPRTPVRPARGAERIAGVIR